jgi:hypothetical protein
MYTQWTNIIRGRVSIQDFTFAKEVVLGSYKCVITLAVPRTVGRADRC